MATISIFPEHARPVSLNELIGAEDDDNHHLSRVQVYTGDEQKVTDAFAITEKEGKLRLESVSEKDVVTTADRPRELNVVLDFFEENGTHVRLHVVHHKGQTLLSLDRAVQNVHPPAFASAQERGTSLRQVSQEGDISDTCIACDGSGSAYLSEGLYGPCMECDAGDLASIGSFDD
jgi:hypothetical protein